VADAEVKAAMSVEQVDPDVFTRDLLSKASGNFLYLKSILTGIQEALTDSTKRERLRHLLNVEELPADLGALYGYFIAAIVDSERSRFGEGVWREYLRPLLGALAVAQEPLSEESIMAFSGLKREDIRDVLRELHQFVETVVSESPAYRIYHTSFSEYLLDKKHNHDYWIDGKERYSDIAERYLKVWGGLDAGLPGLQMSDKRDLDNSYGLRHLVALLGGAGRVDDLHWLLRTECIETIKVREQKQEQENVPRTWLDLLLRRRHIRTVTRITTRVHSRYHLAWYEVQEQAGNTTGFLGDVARTWQLAEDADANTLNAEVRGREISLQCRYALITASINSMAANIYPELLLALVESKIWSLAQGLAYARRIVIPKPKSRPYLVWCRGYL
jgi:hypothetical protein